MYLHARTQAKLLPDYINALEAAVKRGELCVAYIQICLSAGASLVFFRLKQIMTPCCIDLFCFFTYCLLSMLLCSWRIHISVTFNVHVGRDQGSLMEAALKALRLQMIVPLLSGAKNYLYRPCEVCCLSLYFALLTTG